MKHIVIGSKGEVGKALMEVLAERYSVFGLDVGSPDPGFAPPYEVMHIAIPYSETFYARVSAYLPFLSEDGLLIVHSTVKCGTTAKFGSRAVHSPIRGVHPHLAAGIRTFEKCFGGVQAARAAEIFSALGIPVALTPRPEDTEAAKLWCTTAFGLQVMIEKAIHRFCSEHGLDFAFVYSQWTKAYNEGYCALGMPHVVRPVLQHKPGRIGGHCVTPNAEHLDHWLAEVLLRADELLHPEPQTG